MFQNPTFLGVPNKGDEIRIGCLTSAFSGAHKSVEMLHDPYILGGPQQGDKIRIGCLTPAFSGAHTWAEMLHNPYILGGPQQRGRKQNWLPHLCLLRGPQVGGNAT